MQKITTNPRGRRARRARGARGIKRDEVDRAQIVRFTPNVFGFPDRILTRLRYVDNFPITSTSGAQGLQVYRWNSTFDPDQTGTGHQPLYRDTYATIYNHYAVVRAHARIEFVNAVTTVPFVVGCVTDDDGSVSSSANTVAEHNHAVSRFISPLSGSVSNHVIEMDWECKKILNIDPFSSETYKTAVGSNPDEISTLAIFVYTTDASTNSMNFRITLTQEVLWTELATVSGS